MDWSTSMANVSILFSVMGFNVLVLYV